MQRNGLIPLSFVKTKRLPVSLQESLPSPRSGSASRPSTALPCKNQGRRTRSPKMPDMEFPASENDHSFQHSSLGRDAIPVMQAAESRERDNLMARRLRARSSTSGRVLSQSEMSSVLVVITHVVFQQPSEVPLVENDHVVE